MAKIIFGIPAKRMVNKASLNYAAFVLQPAPLEKGKAYKMQLSDPALDIMEINTDEKNSIAIASIDKDLFLIKVDDQLKETIPAKDVCMVYADGSLSNRRLFMHLIKLLELNSGVKNTFKLEKTNISSGVPGIADLQMFKLILDKEVIDPAGLTNQSQAQHISQPNAEDSGRIEPGARIEPATPPEAPTPQQPESIPDGSDLEDPFA